MKIIKPISVNDSILIGCSVPENDYPQWVAGTYTVGQRVIKLSTHRIYEALTTTTADPEIGVSSSPPSWLDIGATNRWKAFDKIVNAQVSNATDIVYTFQPAEIVNSVAFLNLDCESVNITVTDSIDGEVFNETHQLVSDSGIDNWYSYFFEPIIRQTDFVSFSLPSYIGAEIQITFSGINPAVGEIILGTFFEIGVSELGASAGIIDYSRKLVDDFGNITIVQRAYAKRNNIPVTIETPRVDEVYKVLANYRSTPLLWAASEEFSSLILYGYYKSFDIVIAYRSVSNCNLEIEGLT